MFIYKDNIFNIKMLGVSYIFFLKYFKKLCAITAVLSRHNKL